MMGDTNIDELIADRDELRDLWKRAVNSLMRQDAELEEARARIAELEAATTEGDDVRDPLIALIARNMPGRDGIEKVQDVWLADAILEQFQITERRSPSE